MITAHKLYTALRLANVPEVPATEAAEEAGELFSLREDVRVIRADLGGVRTDLAGLRSEIRWMVGFMATLQVVMLGALVQVLLRLGGR